MGFLAKIKEDVMVACGRHCCLCHKFCGLKIEIHHIKPQSEGGPDTFENAIPLCFDCHADMRSYDTKHPKGTKYTEKELIRHKTNWFQKVQNSAGVLPGNLVADTDKIIYQQFLEILPWEGSLKFISNYDFAGSPFDINSLNDLDKFNNLCENPNFEFIDSDLESHKSSLYSKIRQFLRLIATKTFPTNIPRVNSIPQEWEETNPQQFHDTVNKIHNTADAIITEYKSLTKMATRKLGVVPDISF